MQRYPLPKRENLLAPKNITEDIVSMIDDSNCHQCTPNQSTRKSLNPATNQMDNKSQANGSEYMSHTKPPFLNHYKSSNEKKWFKYVGYR